MESKLTLLVICLMFISCLTVDAQLDVTAFGAVGDGQTDDSSAFLKAWKALCQSSKGSPSLTVPEGNYLLSPVVFKGPCNAPSVHIQLDGTIVAPKKQDWEQCAGDWIAFSSVDRLIIDGSGGFDSQGASWWGDDSYRSKMIKKKLRSISYENCDDKPTSVRFLKCTNLQLSGIRSVNSIRNHFSITRCDGASISGLHIEAPGDSPNTDGIDISSTHDAVIQNSFIGTGDDCIAVNSGVKNLTVDTVHCGPGHGISIGSLGKNGRTETVEDVIVQNCNFSDVQNAARIKTWAGGNGYVRRIRYINIRLENAGKPIIIDQHYCPEHDCDTSVESSLEISDVKFINFQGSSPTKGAITLNCSGVGPGCTDTILDHVNIERVDGGGDMFAICNNVHGTATETIPNVPCLS